MDKANGRNFMEPLPRQILDGWGQKGFFLMLFGAIAGGIFVCLFIAAAMAGIESVEPTEF